MRQVVISCFSNDNEQAINIEAARKKHTDNQVCPEKTKVALRIEGSNVKKYIGHG